MKKLVFHVDDGDDNPRQFEALIGDTGITYNGCGTVHLERDAEGRRRMVIQWDHHDAGAAAIPEMIASHLNMLWLPVPTPAMKEQLLALSERVSLLEAKLAK